MQQLRVRPKPLNSCINSNYMRLPLNMRLPLTPAEYATPAAYATPAEYRVSINIYVFVPY